MPSKAQKNISKPFCFPGKFTFQKQNSLCEQHGILTGFSPQLLTLLTDHAVASRYPGEEPTLEEAHHSIEIAKTVRKFARQWLGLK
jgi:hypothetical protein